MAQKRADWGVTIETIAEQAGLRFRPLRAEHYDFAVSRPIALGHGRRSRRCVALLEPGSAVRAELGRLGFEDDE